ncbi:SDR family oxidoreductase [Staphylococcus cohnii]|uniref:SDR family oxidoreductase n=1 Tax=Staphylococcus cohnii TaxID=29382 RepID=UPI0018685966|nr:SDR family oxidoreductase [Staphylococcus cohnii]MCE5034943.1 SDR family oxidoreductase [Staphylococcus cohnii]
MANYIIFGGEGQIGKYYIENYINLDTNNVIIVDQKNNADYRHKNIKYFNIDVYDKNQYNDLITFLTNKKIYIDFFLFSVGINFQEDFFTSTIDNFTKTINTNFIGFYISLKMLYSFLSEHSSVVTIASQNGIVGHENRIDYSPSKAALIQIIKNLTVDFSKDKSKDIKLNAISPGYIYTDRNIKFFNSIHGKKMAKRNPYNKLPKLNDVCGVIQFLFSDASYAIRGENIVVDFGYTIV